MAHWAIELSGMVPQTAELLCFSSTVSDGPRRLRLLPTHIPPQWSSGKASASRVADLGSITVAHTDVAFSWSSHTSDLNIAAPVVTLPGAWQYTGLAGAASVYCDCVRYQEATLPGAWQYTGLAGAASVYCDCVRYQEATLPGAWQYTGLAGAASVYCDCVRYQEATLPGAWQDTGLAGAALVYCDCEIPRGHPARCLVIHWTGWSSVSVLWLCEIPRGHPARCQAIHMTGWSSVSSSYSAFPARSLGFTILGEIFAHVKRFWVFICLFVVVVFNPTIEVVTFRHGGWFVLGVFLLPTFTRLGHEYQDLLSPCDGAHVCTD